ncbi:12623_t:CDS:1, partial [Acaulospora colombiana]
GNPNYGRASPMKGRKHSDETKAKMSAALKGAGNPNHGKKLSDETKAKLSAARLGEKNPRFNTGTPVYLYVVHTYGLELTSSHFNTQRRDWCILKF